MDLENFITNLSEEDFLQVVKFIEKRKAISQNRMKLIDFIEILKYELSPKLKKLLLQEAKEIEYVDQLLRAKLLRHRTIGMKSMTELEHYFRRFNIEPYYFVSVPRIYLNDLVIKND